MSEHEDAERDAPRKPAPTHEGSVESFARRRAAKQRGRDPSMERAKIAAHARTLRAVQAVVATGLALGVAYLALELWRRDRILPMLGLVGMGVIAIVRILRGAM